MLDLPDVAGQEPTGVNVVQPTSMEWLVTGRESVLDAIVDVLNPGPGSPTNLDPVFGVLLTGPSGIGKSHLAVQALKLLQGDVLVFRLYASARMAGQPYGALAALLSELEPGKAHPVQVLAKALHRLQDMSNGKSICILVDNANELDEHSAIVLTQLARTGHIRLLLTCGTSDPLPRELSNLVKDNFIRRIAVEPFSFVESVRSVEARLGARVSSLAGRKLWKASGGNPLFLVALSDDMQKSRSLVCRDGVWCLDDSAGGREQTSSDLFANQLRRLSPSERRALEMVSLARSMSIETLLTVSEGNDIDALERMGVVAIGSGNRVKASSPLLARVVRSHVPTGRSNELWETVNAHAPLNDNIVSSNLGLVLWTLECGRKLNAEVALAAATLANEEMEPTQALRILATIGPEVSEAASTAEEVRSHVILGDGRSANELLKVFYGGDHGEPTLNDWVRLLLAETSGLLSSKVTWPEAYANLEKVRGELYPDSLDAAIAPMEANVEPLRTALAAAGANAAWWTGNYAEAREELCRSYMVARGPMSGDALLVAAHLSLALAAEGSATKAMEIADRVRARIEDLPASQGSVAKAREFVFFANLVAGRLEAAEDVARSFSGLNSEDACLHETEFADLALPIMAVARGHGGQCLNLLNPEIAQLRVHDHNGALGLALSTAAYASVLSGDHDAARRYLAELAGYQANVPWLIERLGLYFELMAMAKVGEEDASIGTLLELADADKSQGRDYWEMTTLGCALRLGATRAAGRLMTAAEQAEGRVGEYYRAFAEGVLNQDAGILALAAELAAEDGNDAAAVEAAEAALAFGSVDQHLHRHLSGLMDSSRRSMDINTTRASDGQSLTARQLEIATLAAGGASNKDIAAALHVSIRTVEGHLYQIFGKLRISERSDLQFALDHAKDGWL